MASRYIGVNLGGSQKGIVESSSTTSKDVEIVVNMASFPTRGGQAQLAGLLEWLENYINEHKWPLA